MAEVVSPQMIPDNGIQVAADQVRGAAILCREGNMLGSRAVCVLEDNAHADVALQQEEAGGLTKMAPGRGAQPGLSDGLTENGARLGTPLERFTLGWWCECKRKATCQNEKKDPTGSNF